MYFNKNVLRYLLYTYLWSWGFWGALAASGMPIDSAMSIVLFGLAGAGPFISTMVLVFIRGEAEYKKDFLRRVKDFRLIDGKWYAIIIGIIPMVSILALILYSVYAGKVPSLPTFSSYMSNPLSLLPFAAFMMIFGPLPEEVGWRGYLQDNLEKTYEWVHASFIVGCCWAAWHIPLLFVKGSYQEDLLSTSYLLVADFFIGFFFLSIITGWIRHNTNKSILSAILFHFFTNYVGEVLDVPTGAMYLRTVIEAAIAVAIILSWQKNRVRNKN